MICPQCGAEYREGFTRCSDCGADLVDEVDAPARTASVDHAADEAPAHEAAPAYVPLDPSQEQTGQYGLVTVLATMDRNLIVVAESILRSAGIPFVSQADDIADLFGAGRLGYCNPVTGSPRLLVAPDDAQDARALLAELQSSL